MKKTSLKRITSLLLCITAAAGFSAAPLGASAAVLPDDYEVEYENKPYDSLGILEDQYDLIEPQNNLYPIISPSSLYDTTSYFKGSYEEVEDFFRQNGMTDGLPVIPPTKIKAEKFMGYSAYGFYDEVASVNGRSVKAYQVAANAVMAGCSPEYTPVCIAFTQALGNKEYLDSLRSGALTPMMYINGPVARQIGIDNMQGMTTEECNISIARFMELALINLAGIGHDRTNNFGNVQPLVFSENDELCLKIGWKPHHVEKGYNINDNIITATSFAMWGNNVTPATDLPDEIMKIIAWDITEKNLGGLGGKSVEENADTKRLIFITESVATALSAKYKSKDALESALVENARRPLWMRAYAYYYANTGGALSRSFNKVYGDLKANPKEDAKLTASPAWMNGITYANIDTVATMTKGNTEIIITGDSSRNKTQVMPGGVSVMKPVELSDRWNDLVTSMNYFPIEDFYLDVQPGPSVPSVNVPADIPNGTYRIVDPTTLTDGAIKSKGLIYYDTSTGMLHYYPRTSSEELSVYLDISVYNGFIMYLKNLGANSSFSIENGEVRDIIIRFPSNPSRMTNNTTALTSGLFGELVPTLHANSTNSNTAGRAAKDGAIVVMSDTVRSMTVDLDGDLIFGGTTEADFVTLENGRVNVDPNVRAGAAAVIGTSNDDGTYRTLTFTNGGDGTYTVKYNTNSSLEIGASTVYLKLSGGDATGEYAFEKTSSNDIVVLTKALFKGTYRFTVYDSTAKTDCGSDETITDTIYRTAVKTEGVQTELIASGGEYEFKYELSTKKLSVYFTKEDIPASSDIEISSDSSDSDTADDSSTDTDIHTGTDSSVTSDNDTESNIHTDSETPSDTDVSADSDSDIQGSDTDVHTSDSDDNDTDSAGDTDSDKNTDSGKDTDTAVVSDSDIINHVWSDPVFTWYGTRKATASFTCDSDEHHVERVDAVITSETTPALCDTDGKTVYTASVEFYGKKYTDTKTVVIEKTGHNYGEPEWTWNGYQTVFAAFTCSNGKTHTEYVNADVTSVTTPATCEKKGATVYTATIEFNGKTYSDKRTLEVSRKGHIYKLASWNWDGFDTASALFVCEYDSTHQKIIQADVSSESGKDGTLVYTASVEFEGNTYTDTKTSEIESIGLLGDVDGDGMITANDALMILRQSVGFSDFTPEQTALADADGDGSITANDALAVLLYSAGASQNGNIGKPV